MGQKYAHVSLDERCEIYRLHADGKSQRAIGRLMGRSASTIGRELKRNALPRAGYKPAMAERMAWARKRRLPKIERLSPLKTHILDALAMEQSPEQIAGRLKLEGSEHTISAETIYAWIYGPHGRRRKLHRLLPQAKSRRGRRARKGRRDPPIPDRMPIHMRPTKAHLRAEPGHWEADLVHFRKQRACLLTCIERRSRLLLTATLPDKTARTTAEALARLLNRAPKRARKTVTLDNGGEFYDHKSLPVRAFFCDPHSPWQRGSIENANGVLRRSLPRHIRLNKFSDQDIEDITWTYNTTPRKCLGFLTPIEAFAKSIGVALEI
ncbi:IS30 family transposase [Magnetospira sp. QH-2]|uniref:IS30 family transposase n=1 Tax=Magnetospira sp. (strain QH-2) TaxID=1288970 RepID=UPI0003E81873|nr:IS30 family transposase [Magnetospira sp. QH-2]CCQ72016.1 transposase [Magnetospira sp. QH-2]CCQ72642.1 transposase [Magnetospira sp. QH-2]CCQ73533.1 transposase [Magnetospira sp. QH-2]CCQ74227.1 transposase [Magnetospira sp. QH-2]